MKLRFKEDPKEWRKSALLTALGLAIIISLLRWRRHLPASLWCALLVSLGFVAICAVLRPRWFRGYYRISLWLGFYSSRFVGCCVLAVFFVFILTPLGFMLRLMGKDPLQLKRPRNAATHWHEAKACSPLDRLF